MNNSLFRDEALSAISSPEQLDQHIKIIRPSNWIIIIGALSVIIAVLYWCFFGNITNTTKVMGIIFPQSGVSNIVAKNNGLVSDVLVREGEYVSQGQIIALIPNKQIIDNIINLKEEISLTSDISLKSELQEEYDKLVINYEYTSVIKSEISGIVQNIVERNRSVTEGEIIASIINDNIAINNKELIVYVPYSISEKFKPGMEAQISPVYAPREEYGFIKGYITSVGIVPATNESYISTFGNLEYVKDLSINENSVELRIMMAIDSSSENSFLWSNPKGKSLNINIGTICNVLIIFDSFHPIELLFRS